MKQHRHCKNDLYERPNREAAGIILSEPERYGGEESLMVRWARLVIQRERMAECPPLYRPVPAPA